MVNQPWSVNPPVNSADSVAILSYEMSRRIARHHHVISYSPRFRGEAATEKSDGIMFRRVSRLVDRAFKPLRLLDSSGLLMARRPHVASVFYYPGYVFHVARDLARQRCDVIHLHNFSQYARVIRAFNPSARIVLHMHCDWLTMLDPHMVRGRIEKTDMILGVSDFITKRLLKQFPDFAPRCRTLYNGVDTDYFCPGDAMSVPPDGQRILYVGRVSPEKGVHVLLEAFEHVLKRFPRATLDIVGPATRACRQFVDPGHDEPLLEPLEEFFRDRESYLPELRRRLSPAAAQNVRFVGCVPHAGLRSYFQNSDLFVIPSIINEPFGIPLAEAMSSGVPAIATLGGGFPEINEDRRTGLLVPRGDAPALAEAIMRLLADRPLRLAMGVAARQRVVERFSWDVIIPQLEEAYGLAEPRCSASTAPKTAVPARHWRRTAPREKLQYR